MKKVHKLLVVAALAVTVLCLICCSYNQKRRMDSPNSFARTWDAGSGEIICGVALDSHRNICAGGWTCSLGAGFHDAMLLKYDKSGTLQWVRTWGGKNSDEIHGIAIDSGDNIYAAGRTESFRAEEMDALLLKYDSSGTLQWAKTWGGGGWDLLSCVAVDSTDNIYTAGWTKSFGAGETDALLLKYDSSGTLQWARTWGEQGSDQLFGIAVDSTGNICAAGSTYNSDTGRDGALLLKYNSSGALQWVKTWNLNNYDVTTNGVVVDPVGNIYTGGYIAGCVCSEYNDAFVMKYNNSGVLQWVKIWDGSREGRWVGEVIRRLVVDSNGNVYAAGQIGRPEEFAFDALLLKYDPSGTLQWAKTWCGSGDSSVIDITIDPSDNVFLGGGTTSSPGVWKAITAGAERIPTGTQGLLSGIQGVPSGIEGAPASAGNSPGGCYQGEEKWDVLLLKNW